MVLDCYVMVIYYWDYIECLGYLVKGEIKIQDERIACLESHGVRMLGRISMS
jgi:hypothetical protein